jgi:surfeit locus 1 family protein
LARYAQVRLAGRYDGEHQFLLDNMSHAGQPGYQVLTPLLLADGRAFIVNRGWVPSTGSRARLPQIQLDAAAPAMPAGRLDQLPVAALALGHVPPAPGPQWPKLTSFPTMADLALSLGRKLETRQLLLNPDEPQGYVRDWHPGGLGATRHLSYAVQWWIFAALALGLYVYMNRQKAVR